MTRECHMKFELLATDGAARRGVMRFPRGDVQTPAFMPVGTYGTVKAMPPRDILEIGAEILLGNTFHLMLRPGTEVQDQRGRCVIPFAGRRQPRFSWPGRSDRGTTQTGCRYCDDF